MNNDESELNELFARYRAACPDIDPGPSFMPVVWQKIEARRGFWWTFQGFSRTAMAGCAALTLALLALNFLSSQPLSSPSYTDALMADHSAERTYYAESVPRHAVGEEDSH